jgi:hypothetical protein
MLDTIGATNRRPTARANAVMGVALRRPMSAVLNRTRLGVDDCQQYASQRVKREEAVAGNLLHAVALKE